MRAYVTGRWHDVKTETGKDLVPPRTKEWLTRNGFSARMWAAELWMEVRQCPADQLGPGLVLEMADADPDAKRLVMN